MLPPPFSRLLLSMNRSDPQLGTDGVRHPLTRDTGVKMADGLYIYDLVRQTKALRTAEVGFAEGFSTMYFLAALKSNGGGVHVAMDPYEVSEWHGIGLQEVQESGMKDRFRFLNAKSIAGLPALNQEGQPYEIIFIDGDHRFDGAFTDFVLADAICSKGGYILMHDFWMPSVKKVTTFVERNRSDYVRRAIPGGVNMVVFQKVGEDRRDWRHYVDF
jgi:predicted O-methyltransferase YrrM